MNVGTLLLALWLLLTGGEQLGWFSVDIKVMGVVAILAAISLVIGGLGILTIPLPTIRRRAQ